MSIKNIMAFMGVQSGSVPVEQVVAACGGVISICLIALVSFHTTGLQGTAMIVPSMGASTVLLFAVPHGPLSQPWALFAGNLIPAVIGVSCATWIGVSIGSAGLAVGLSIGAMHLARCIHPPGGATALAAVIGGPAIQDLGFGYVLTPVLLNCGVIFLVALVFNGIFPWRRYPQSLMRYATVSTSSRVHELSTDQIRRAMQELQVFVDISLPELTAIYDKARELAVTDKSRQLGIEAGAFYTNGRPGRDWSVRQIVDVSPHRESRHYLIIYRVVDGKGIHATGSCTLEEFTQWAAARMRPAAVKE